ncbi:MAG: hypothetical protein C4519_02080 [Desulfobacteraceae bacterium]|nr:MAG: hypothetical protein C4519_02080 [Desulfobacteraceae bacterium]
MISITSFLHRDVLKNLIRRWMYNQYSHRDADALIRLVHFNTAYISRYLPLFSEQVFRRLHDAPLSMRPSRRKADLKDAIVLNCPYHNARIEQMLSEYRSDPGLFYRETPFHGLLYFTQGPDGPRVIGSSRIKRGRRLAEKTARRIIDAIFASIRDTADALARDRATCVGVPLAKLITPPNQMVEEFQKAENRLLADLKAGRPILLQDNLVIQDVAGIKVLVEDRFRDEFVADLRKIENCELIEIEEHRGKYNALNLIVRYRPDRQALIAKPPSDRMLHLMQLSGMPPEQVHQQFKEFVLTAEEHVHIEVIVCSYQEMLESEIGRCMHEDRILQQRLNQQYTGVLARNIEFLVAYLFAFAASPQTKIEELPIRLWGRYLPDYFDEVLMGLFDLPRLEIIE